MTSATLGLFLGAVTLGVIHGIEPGHGWPVAAVSALDHTRKWLWGLAAALLLGVGHLVSSIAVVLVFFLTKRYFNLQSLNDPLVLPGGVEIGGAVGITAGLLLIGLGIWEYATGHAHDHEHEGVQKLFGEEPEHDHDDDHEHHHDHDHEQGGNHTHTHVDHGVDTEKKRGLWGIAGFAFLLGFIHEEEFEIIAMCTGSELCLELMLVYAVTVILAITGMTMLMVAGYHHFKERVRGIEPYLPQISASILMLMGVGFILGYF